VQARDELVHEARLPDPGLTLDQNHLPRARLRLLERLVQRRQFGVATEDCGLARNADAADRTLRVFLK
jgi:hypothetical protein